MMSYVPSGTRKLATEPETSTIDHTLARSCISTYCGLSPSSRTTSRGDLSTAYGIETAPESVRTVMRPPYAKGSAPAAGTWSSMSVAARSPLAPGSSARSWGDSSTPETPLRGTGSRRPPSMLRERAGGSLGPTGPLDAVAISSGAVATFVTRSVVLWDHSGAPDGAQPNDRLPGDTTRRDSAAASASMRPAPATNGPTPRSTAVFIRRDFTISGVHSGCSSSMSAATPATCGAAIDVPLSTCVPPPGQHERIATPGATTSGLMP